MTKPNVDFTEYLSCLGLGSESYERAPQSEDSPPKPLPQNDINIENYLDNSWSASSRILVVAELRDPDSPSERELLEKMLGAIHLGPSNARLVTLKPMQFPGALEIAGAIFPEKDLSSALFLLFPDSRSLLSSTGPGPVQNWLVTHSAAECLDNPGLKKAVWEDLKSFRGMLDR